MQIFIWIGAHMCIKIVSKLLLAFRMRMRNEMITWVNVSFTNGCFNNKSDFLPIRTYLYGGGNDTID